MEMDLRGLHLLTKAEIHMEQIQYGTNKKISTAIVYSLDHDSAAGRLVLLKSCTMAPCIVPYQVSALIDYLLCSSG